MGKITSAATVYATAYLTEKGRSYLFNKNNVRFDANGNDLFQVIKFTLSDPDANYNTQTRLDSGDVPDVTGKSEGCLKSSSDYVQTTYAYAVVDALSFADPSYNTDLTGNILAISVDDAWPTPSATDVPPTIYPVVNGGVGIFLPWIGGNTP